MEENSANPITEPGFINALRRLRELDDDTIIQRVHNLYSAIAKMDTEDTIAAGQTLKTIYRACHFDNYDMNRLQEIYRAICTQAYYLVSSSRDDHGLHDRFRQAFGRCYHTKPNISDEE